MSLLRDVVSVLDAEAVPHALIGAAAMAIHGVARATADVDLLVVDARVLPRLPADARRLWEKIRAD